MGIREIPKQVFYVCDLCGTEKLAASDVPRKPPHWSTMSIATSDMSGPVMDTTTVFMLCITCSNRMLEMVGALKEKGVVR
jgi:hypothetical protein